MAIRTHRNIFSFFIFFAATLAFGGSADLSPKTRDLIDRFFSPPQFANVQLSPGGSHLAFFKEVQGQLILATYNFKTARLALTDPDVGQVVVDFDWISPDQILFDYIQRSVPGHPQTETRGVGYAPIHPENFENIYLGHWVVDADLKHLERIPDVGPIYEMVDPLPQDPTSVLLATQTYDKFYSPLYRYDPTKNTVKLIEENPGRVRRSQAHHLRPARSHLSARRKADSPLQSSRPAVARAARRKTAPQLLRADHCVHPEIRAAGSVALSVRPLNPV